MGINHRLLPGSYASVPHSMVWIIDHCLRAVMAIDVTIYIDIQNTVG